MGPSCSARQRRGGAIPGHRVSSPTVLALDSLVHCAIGLAAPCGGVQLPSPSRVLSRRTYRGQTRAEPAILSALSDSRLMTQR
ncbi:hypothetical protein ON010_g16672 [Phytophthora cinnamomi]|nr:hypothetical protein ON010_g16672 [Phytophthora cinnamomi]